MSTEGPENEDLLLERLQQAASGDAAVRQLRRRYDLLRRDYEHLLDRLGELEERLGGAAPEEPAPPPPPSRAARMRPQSPSEEALENPLREGLVAPLLRLRDDYLGAASGIQAIVAGLDSLAAAAFKGQHAAAPAAPGGGPAAGAERLPATPQRIQLEVKGGGFGELLDFQERLSALSGVARVSINAIDNERATLIVELESVERQS